MGFAIFLVKLWYRQEVMLWLWLESYTDKLYLSSQCQAQEHKNEPLTYMYVYDNNMDQIYERS